MDIEGYSLRLVCVPKFRQCNAAGGMFLGCRIGALDKAYAVPQNHERRIDDHARCRRVMPSGLVRNAVEGENTATGDHGLIVAQMAA